MLEKHFLAAAKQFRKAHEINPRFANAAHQLVKISTYGHTDESGKYWFEKATEYAKGFAPVYLSYSRSLLPKWGGANDEYYEFLASHAKACLQSDGPIAGDPAIAGAFLEGVIRLSNEFKDNAKFRKFIERSDRSATLFDVIDELLDRDQEVVINELIRKQDLSFDA